MLNGNVRPSTLEGLKRLANQIKKDRGIRHAEALDLAARAAHFSNYKHALTAFPLEPVRHQLFLTVYWFDRETYRGGRETLELYISKPVLEMCGKSELKNVRGFGDMRMVAADHFVSDSLAHAQDYAQSVLGKAERSLRFIEHTGLRPSRKYRKAYPGGSPHNKLPGADHTTNWVDPASGQFILVDEPYRQAPDDAKRAAWADRHGWHLRKASHPGLYSPYACDLYVATDSATGYDVGALMAKIDAVPVPPKSEEWYGVSAPSMDVFLSPAATTPQDKRRARSRGTIQPEPSARTIPYSSMFGNRQRRPAGKLGVEGHKEAGRIIKAVLHSRHRPYSVHTRMNSVRSTLEDWLGLEIGRTQLDGPEFFDVYYHDPDEVGPYAEAAQSSGGLIRILEELKAKLKAAYPSCAPLREQLHRIDMSISLIERMTKSGYEGG